VRVTCNSRTVGPHCGPCFMSPSAYRICRWLRNFGKSVGPGRMFESVLIPLTRGIACEGNILTFFSLWIVDQCTREKAEHDGGFLRAFLSIYQDGHFKWSALEATVSVEIFYHIALGVCTCLWQSKRHTVSGTSVIFFPLIWNTIHNSLFNFWLINSHAFSERFHI
jgi:hypothetical protein